MRRLSLATLGLSLCLAAVLPKAAADDPPPWAYGFTAPASAAPPLSAAAPARPGAPDETPQTIPGTQATFTLAQIRDSFGPADWFPEDHPRMPGVVARGRRPGVRACAMCHYPNGKGRPENAGIAGLPVEYFIQTIADFRNDRRRSADSRKNNTNTMISIAKAMTDDEIRAAAEYFGQMAWTPWVKVVETNTVPATRIAGGMFIRLDGGEMEPLGARIIEVPEDAARTELRDPRSGFMAYVPTGSVARGAALVANGAGKTTACGVCHGEDLMGMGPVPGIAGRSPSYIVRQLYDMQTGARKGTWSALMEGVVANLSADDMIDIAAFTASRQPQATRE